MIKHDNNVWMINGECYDLSKFIHPGGPISLECGKGRDCTILFKSYHVFTEKPLKILQKYKIKKPKNCDVVEQDVFDTNNESEFAKELKQQVFEKVFKNGEITHYASTERWIHILVLFLLLVLSAFYFWKGHYWALFAFPLTFWVLGVNTFHDASHFALSKHWRVNALFTYATLLISPFTWYHQHIIGHHVYTNVHKRDPDLHHGTYTWRVHEKQRWYHWYHYQKYYFWFIWLTMQLSLCFIIDAFFISRESFHRMVPSMHLSKKRKMVHILGRIVVFFLAFLLPLFNSNLTWGMKFLWIYVPLFIIGLCFAFSTQLNHLVGETFKESSSDWYKHQVVTAHSFAPQSLFWFFFTGGLNIQTSHHLFPGVCQWHLRKVEPIVEELCEKYGIRYNCSKTALIGFQKHYSHLADMGVDPKLVQ